MTEFEKKVTRVVRMIPKGKVATYSTIAKMAGRPKAARAVGTILKNNRSKLIPCHRVVHADGSLGGYNSLAGNKADLLKKEGMVIVSGYADLSNCQWKIIKY